MRKHIVHSGSKVHYSDEGIGHVIVLLHGFGESGSIWSAQLSFLRQHGRVIVPDLPGSGESPYPDTGSGHLRLEDHAELMARILDAEDISRCTMIGHSMGGYITLAFAERYPEMLQGFGLVHSTAMPDNEAKKSLRLRSISFMEKNGAESFLSEAIPKLYGGRFIEEHPGEVRRHVAESAAQFKAHVLCDYYRAMMERPDRRHVLRDFKGPVLMIAGEDDLTVPLQEFLSQCPLPAECHVSVWQGAAHMGMREAPARMNTELLNFLLHVNAH